MIDKSESKTVSGVKLYRCINADGSRGGWVSDSARVSGRAPVSGYARVSDNRAAESPLYVQGTRHAATNCTYGYIAIGCEVYDFETWLHCYHDIGVQHGYTPEQISEYKRIIDFIVANGK